MKISHKFLALCFLFSLLAVPQTHAMQPGGGRGWKKPAIIISSILAGIGICAYMEYRTIKKAHLAQRHAAWNRLDTETQEMLHEEMIRYKVDASIINDFPIRTTER